MPVSRIKYLIISIFVLALIAWIIEGLIASEKIMFSSHSMTEVLGWLAESLKYMVFVAFFAVAAGSLAISIIHRRMLIEVLKRLIRRPQDDDSQSLKKNILVWIVSFSIFLLIMWLFAGGGSGILGFPILDGEQSSSTEDGGVSATAPPNGSVVTALPFMSTLLMLSGLLIVATTFAAGLLFVQALRESREEAEDVTPMLEEESLQEQALNLMGETIAEIQTFEEASDFRETIIKCYQRFCELLAQHNCKIQKHETAQEFRVHASRLLNIPDAPLSRLTDLFEEARYSKHEIDEAKRSEALKCLEEIRGYLTGERNV